MPSLFPPRRSVTLKADRDTLLLLAAAIGMTLALAYAVHGRPPARPDVEAATGGWTGELAALQPAVVALPSPTEPLSSAALVVPKAAMALPAAPSAPTVAPARPRGCDRPACAAPAKVAAVPVPPPAPTRRAAAPVHPIREANLADTLNPLNHIPDVVKRPLASAGDTIAGWVRRF